MKADGTTWGGWFRAMTRTASARLAFTGYLLRPCPMCPVTLAMPCPCPWCTVGGAAHLVRIVHAHAAEGLAYWRASRNEARQGGTSRKVAGPGGPP